MVHFEKDYFRPLKLLQLFYRFFFSTLAGTSALAFSYLLIYSNKHKIRILFANTPTKWYNSLLAGSVKLKFLSLSTIAALKVSNIMLFRRLEHKIDF